SDGLGACTALRLLFSGGEALPSSTADLAFERLPSAELHNLYGPTEATIDATAWACRRESHAGATVPIGYPVRNTQVHILDARMQGRPIGGVGEIYVGGIQLARGYLARPDLTADRFVPHPFGTPGERLYRTGDLGRYCHDGRIEYLGRTDSQVKIRGN